MSWSSYVARYKDPVQRGNDSRTSDSDETGCVEICKASDSLLHMKFYALSSGVVSHLLTGCDGNEMDFPFELTDEEMEVIHFRKSSFILGRSGTGKTTVLIMKLFQREQLYHLASEGYHEVESSSTNNVSCGSEVQKKENILRQIFVTVNVRLCYAVKGGSQAELEDIDEMSLFSDIPDSFADLSPCSYPLVITFNKFLMMLNGTVGRSFFERFPELRIFYQEKRKNSRSTALKTFIRTKEVRYDKFCSSYWQHFSQQLTKKLDPSTVFAEIISHIKGGLWKKKTNGEFDLSDLVLDLHQRLRKEIFEAEKMDFVYIDEVQDLTIRQISLFKYICRNFEEGFVFSGDTAQTIARGVDFRFQDIKTLFYKEFGACERTGKGKITDLFHLRQNFRTHAGVLKLANSVLDLVLHFFPSSIDKLDPETSLISGEKPVWVQMKNGENALASFFKGSNIDNGLKGFGAEQVILVRDESARNEVLSHVGKQALVLTVIECKGLEFQDVLLYNFFSSSLLKDQLEVIYGYMEKQNLLKFTAEKPFPIFNEGTHTPLCSELKQLYVAITRTRQRLWIFENQCCSMFNYWEKLCLVQVRELDKNFLQEIQVASSQKEWKARGMKFFHQQNYDKARFCFERAEERYLEKLAMAAGHVYTADHIRNLDPRTARKHLTEAAHIYEFIGKNESAAQCFFELHEYEKAGIIYLEKCGESKLKEAGECFHLAGFHEKAAKIYARCRSFSKCLSVCVDGKLFLVGYQYIKVWKENNFQFPKSEEVQTFLERGALYFHKLRDSESMMIFLKSFESKNQMRTFLKSVDRLDELLSLEKEWGNFLEAANVAEMKGDVLLQVDLLEMAGEFKGASNVILFYVLYSSLWRQGSKGWPLKHFVEKDELLKKAKSFAKNASPDFYDFVCIVANILSGEKDNLLELNKCWNDAWRHGSVRSKILCARKILDAYLYPGTLENKWENTLFVDLLLYTENRISWRYISVVTLVERWSFWKDEIEKILSYVKDDSSGDSYGEFLMSYFGVIKQSKNEKTMYLLLCPDAAWIKDFNLHCFNRNGKSWIEASQLVYAAKSYWSSEMLTVGLKVLELLEELYVFSVNKALSIYCKCMLLTQIFEVSKPLVESNLLSNKVQRFLRIPMENFFGLIYPLDWRMPLTKDMICLREAGTSRNLLKEVFNRIISSKPETSAQIGELMMILLSRKFSPDLYVQIEASCGTSISWQVFIKNFRRTMKPHDPIQDTEEVSLVQSFHRALEDTDYTNYSPTCYLYLLDRLVFMVSYLKGYFFTARTSLVEWLLCKGWNVYPNLNFVSDVKEQSLLEVIVKFVARSVHDILYCEFFSSEPAKWMKKYNLQRDFYGLLVLRLFVMLCQLCTNFEVHFSLLFNFLDKEQVTQFLPWKFYQSLRKLKEHDRRERKIEAVAEALKSIGNPLVIVSLGICAENYFPDAIVLYLNVQQDRKTILDTLLPNRTHRKQTS
ncbi:TPR and ankyrin repeat-containing protein 1 [Jatropha curcas]|uniref:TPR and ankyrin repeat-containing protein 1 n=1 Tax=Jatropha curcas TaxID=180498 RepID=UPI0018956DB7|nr:TPR and ankyrin repeat-containing protein 1 [Jatropha curcas]